MINDKQSEDYGKGWAIYKMDSVGKTADNIEYPWEFLKGFIAAMAEYPVNEHKTINDAIYYYFKKDHAEKLMIILNDNIKRMNEEVMDEDYKVEENFIRWPQKPVS